MTIVAPLLQLFLGISIDLRRFGSDAVAYFFVPFIPVLLAAGALVLGVKGRLPGTRP